MTREEVKSAVRMLAAVYPKQFGTPQAVIDTVDAWAFIFAEDDAKTINAAVMVYLNQPHEFAPRPGQLREIIYKELHRDDLTEIEAWNLVAKAIRNGTYGAEEEFAKLPETVQKAIGGPIYLRDLATSEDMNASVESSNFFRRYRTIMERQQADESMPAAIRALIAAAETKQITGR